MEDYITYGVVRTSASGCRACRMPHAHTSSEHAQAQGTYNCTIVRPEADTTIQPLPSREFRHLRSCRLTRKGPALPRPRASEFFLALVSRLALGAKRCGRSLHYSTTVGAPPATPPALRHPRSPACTPPHTPGSDNSLFHRNCC